MKVGVLKLHYKQSGERKDLRNYRPLSMLNTDFKILAQVLANRLKKVLLDVFTTTKSYAVEGRDITDVVLGIWDTLYYMGDFKRQSYLVSIDLEKSFDRVWGTNSDSGLSYCTLTF